jgi:hypothetical protein
MKRVYVAGAYQATNALEMLANIARGVQAGLQVWKAGFAPYVPWLDISMHIANPCPESTTIEECYEWSMSWLEVSDAILIVPGWEESQGTLKEIARACQLGIPVFYSIKDLIKWRKSNG